MKASVATGAYNHIVTDSGLVVLKTFRNMNRVGGSSAYEIGDDLTLVKKSKVSNKVQLPKQRRRVKKTGSYSINKKEVRSRLVLFVRAMKGKKKLFFWTITFPVNFQDDLAYRCFNTWLTRCRRELNLGAYIWVAERQQNGTIHYHLGLNCYMDVRKANKFMRASIGTVVKSHASGINLASVNTYNGVDIAKNRTTKRVINFASKKNRRRLSSYLSKYVTKNDSKFSRFAWHCSREYSALITTVRFSFNEVLNYDVFELVDLKEGFESDFFIFYRWKDGPPGQVMEFVDTINATILKLVCFN